MTPRLIFGGLRLTTSIDNKPVMYRNDGAQSRRSFFKRVYCTRRTETSVVQSRRTVVGHQSRTRKTSAKSGLLLSRIPCRINYGRQAETIG